MSIPQINNVGVGDVNVFRIEVPQIYSLPPATQTVPFILNIGSPVVDLPGCVEYHPDAADNRETPNLKEDDSNGRGFFVMETIQRIMRWTILQKI